MGLECFVVVFLWLRRGFVVVKRGQVTVIWRGEGRDWRGVSWFCGDFFWRGGDGKQGGVFGVGFVKFLRRGDALGLWNSVRCLINDVKRATTNTGILHYVQDDDVKRQACGGRKQRQTRRG
jgi:hypothetical protein